MGGGGKGGDGGRRRRRRRRTTADLLLQDPTLLLHGLQLDVQVLQAAQDGAVREAGLGVHLQKGHRYG